MKRDPLRALRDRPTPDLWGRIEPRLGERPVRTRSDTPREQVLAAVVALAVAAAGLGGLWFAFRGEGALNVAGTTPPPTVVPGTPGPTSATVIGTNYPLDCSARVEDPTVAPGETARIVVTLTNRGSEVVSYREEPTTEGYRVVDGSGAVLFDQGEATPVHPHPLTLPKDLAPGDSAEVPVEIGIRWPGPLGVLVPCPDPGEPVDLPALPALGLTVVPPGPAPDASEALGRALDETGGLFDACRPTASGQEVLGRVFPPDGGTDLVPMEARCADRIESLPGFLRITLQIVTPPDAPPLDVEEGYPADLGESGESIGVFRWTFVATTDSVAPVVDPLSQGEFFSSVQTIWFEFQDGRWVRTGFTSGPGGGGYFGRGFSLVQPAP